MHVPMRTLAGKGLGTASLSCTLYFTRTFTLPCLQQRRAVNTAWSTPRLRSLRFSLFQLQLHATVQLILQKAWRACMT